MSTDRRLTERGHQRRQALVDHATERFADAGYRPTSVADIVDGVGVGKGVFYWYFDSKEALLREILRQALHDLRSNQASAIADANTPLEKLAVGIRASLRWSAANPDIFRIVNFGWTEEPFAAALIKGRRIIVSDTAAIIQEAIDADQIDAGPAEVLATAIHGTTDELARSFHRDPSMDTELLVDTAVRFCLHGLLGRSENQAI